MQMNEATCDRRQYGGEHWTTSNDVDCKTVEKEGETPWRMSIKREKIREEETLKEYY